MRDSAWQVEVFPSNLPVCGGQIWCFAFDLRKTSLWRFLHLLWKCPCLKIMEVKEWPSGKTRHLNIKTFMKNHLGSLVHALWSYKKRWKFPTSPVSYIFEVFTWTLFLNFPILYSHRFLIFPKFSTVVSYFPIIF